MYRFNDTSLKMSFVIVDDYKGDSNLLLDGFRFRQFRRNKNGSIRWHCFLVGCKSFVLTKYDEIVKQCVNHEHNPSTREDAVPERYDDEKIDDENVINMAFPSFPMTELLPFPKEVDPLKNKRVYRKKSKNEKKSQDKRRKVKRRKRCSIEQVHTGS